MGLATVPEKGKRLAAATQPPVPNGSHGVLGMHARPAVVWAKDHGSELAHMAPSVLAAARRRRSVAVLCRARLF